MPRRTLFGALLLPTLAVLAALVAQPAAAASSCTAATKRPWMGPIAAELVPELAGTVNLHARAWVDRRCKPATYVWDLGDGRLIEAYSPTVQYEAPGTYELTFTATDQRGRSASRHVTVVVE